MNRYEGKTVLITGAARGQGRSHALAFAREGADLALCDIDGGIDSIAYTPGSPAQLEETAELVRAEGRRVITAAVDVRDFDAVKAFTDRTVAEFGKLDVAIANAGIASFADSAAELTEEQFDDMLDINLKGVWHTFKAAIPPMRERRYGRLIATGSAAAIKPFHGAAHYVAAKHGVNGLVKTIAIEVAIEGITANTVSPGNVGTDMIFNEAMYAAVDPVEPTKEHLDEAFSALNAQPGGWMEPEEISKAMLHVGSDEAGYMTGSMLVVDMGMTIK
jgi:SDR family mycofactocin-dependent oxidoreductase